MSAARLASLDQFRGLTVLAMFAVNYVGGLTNVPSGLKHHHTYCSFADTIMPQFLFAVGFGMRLSYLRRQETAGTKKAYLHFLGRCLGLIVLGVLLYHFTGKYERFADLTAKPLGEFLLGSIKRGPFETLTHIGVTSLWCLPVIAIRGWGRVLFAIASGGLHVLASHLGYYQWNLTSPVGIDGGPLGFLTWTFPLILGSLTHDWVTRGRLNGTADLFLVGLLIASMGYSLSLLNKLTPPNAISQGVSWRDLHDGYPFGGPPSHYAVNYWTMSQRAGSVTYPLFAAGFALTVYAVFRLLSDRWFIRWGYLDLFGKHALAGYVVHDLADATVKPFVPKDSPWWWVAIGFCLFLGLITVVLRYLDRNRLFLKL